MTRSHAAAAGLAAALLLTLLALWTASAARAGTGAAAPGHVDAVIVLEPGQGEREAKRIAKQVSGRIVGALPRLRAYFVDLPDASSLASRTVAARSDALGSLRSRPGVRTVEPARRLGLLDAHPVATPFASDPYLGNQWHLGRIGAQAAWAVTQGSAAVTIAIVDTGIDYTHPDLAGKVILGPDLGDGDADPRDTHGHGTHVAGIAAATADNGIGVAGVCPGCSLLAVKVFPDGSGSAWDYLVAQGIVWAVDSGAQVINLSLGGPDQSAVTRSAVDYAWSRGAIVVGAAGNSGTSAPNYPGAYDNAIGVVATTSTDARASYSNYGPWADVAAPGSGILSTVPGGGYASWSGTSMATPVVAGTAGLAFSALGGGAAAVRAALEAGVVDLGAPGRDDQFGWGRIDLAKLLGAQTPPPEPEPTPQPEPEPQPPAVSTASLPAAQVGAAYQASLAATGGAAPYTWSLSAGVLPAGLALDPASGAIAGTPTAAGSFTFTVRAADATGASATRSLALAVSPTTSSLDLSGSWTRVTTRTRRGVTTVTARLALRATGAGAAGVTVRFAIVEAGGRAVATRTRTVESVSPGSPVSLTVRWRGPYRGLTALAEIDPADAIVELDETNNRAAALIPLRRRS